MIVHLTRPRSGELRVGEIAEVTRATGVQSRLFKAEGGGRFAPTGHVPSWAEGAPPSTFR